MAQALQARYGRIMECRLRLVRMGSRITRATDVLIPMVLAGMSLTEIWIERFAQPGFHGARGMQTVGALLMTVSLGWRRHYPVAVLACVTIGAGVEWPWNHTAGQVSLEAWLAILIAYYSVGAHLGTRCGVRVIALGMLPLLAADVFDLIGGDHSATALSGGGVYVILVLSWAVGNAFRRRGVRELELETRAERLERERGQNMRIAVAEERARIARELHDVVAHSVSVMVVQMGAAREIMSSEPHTARDTLRSGEATGRQALGELRRMLGILRAGDERGALDPQPRLAHVDGLVEQARGAGLPVALVIDGAARPLPAGIDLAGYRIVQEALTNVRKHAGAAHADVRIHYGEHELALDVCDDGRGPVRSSNGAGHGLVGMRERVALYGGALETGPGTHGGFGVHARLPLIESRP
jgi:signal transduction histidine kinase